METQQLVMVDRVRRRVVADEQLLRNDSPSRAAVRSAVARAVRDEGVLLPPDGLARLARELTDEMAGLGAIEPLLRDPHVTDVLVNSPDEV